MRLGIYVKKNIFLLLRFWVRGHYMGYVKCSNPGFSVWVSDWVHNKTLNIPAILSKKHAHISQYCNGKETEEVRRLFPTSHTTFVWIFGYLCVPTYCILRKEKAKGYWWRLKWIGGRREIKLYHLDLKHGEGISRLLDWSFNTMLVLDWYPLTSDLHSVVLGWEELQETGLTAAMATPFLKWLDSSSGK